MIRVLSFLILATVVLAENKCDDYTSYSAFAGESAEGQTTGKRVTNSNFDLKLADRQEIFYAFSIVWQIKRESEQKVYSHFSIYIKVKFLCNSCKKRR